MNRCLTRALLAATLLPCLTATATPGAPLRINLRVVEGCRLDRAPRAGVCAVAHQRSDAQAPPPPQVQALTPPPPPTGGTVEERRWLTITF